MKIVIFGGTGRIGARLARLLRLRGHHVVPASPSTGVDTVAGNGLADTVSRADVVVDVTDTPSFAAHAAMDFFQTSTRNMVSAAVAARVRHHVVLSIVGADRMPASGYMRAKAAQEKLVEHGLVPYTVVRATQTFESVDDTTATCDDHRPLRLSPVLMQPMAAEDAAAVLADVAEAEPFGGRVDIAGPDRLRQDDLVRTLLAARHDSRDVVTAPAAYFHGASVDDTTLVPARPWRLGGTDLTGWLAGHATNQQSGPPRLTPLAPHGRG
ncbi:SDR family oxidoreductase [Catellatospora coxensis]|uniref:LysR family transcriptional regulator n=1 Tax=Catellatospora coxensis TaxID=310354 RepID=A0A8J3L9X8_9ACTN|nr:SDR family oxidoreductase [Catellatospora coxensis]GIG08940.1 LysR family transcriptional regulator [Catellatospora coxensis]